MTPSTRAGQSGREPTALSSVRPSITPGLPASSNRSWTAASSPAATAFAYKPGAAIVSCRRGGASAAFEQLNKYFTITNMPVVSSQYWTMLHGHTPRDVGPQDLEGLQIMRTLGRNWPGF